MATGKKIGGVQLELSRAEAEFLSGLLIVATHWAKDPIANEIYDALDTEQDTDFEQVDGHAFVSVKDSE